VLVCGAGAGCVQILGLEDPVDGGARADAGPGDDDATMGADTGAPGDAGTDAPTEAAAGSCVPAAACALPGTCDQGTTLCDGGVASCVSSGPLPGCEGQQVCDDDGGNCVCKSTCSSVCVNESNDPANCGKCGHECIVGQCQGSTCQPIVVSNMQAVNDVVLSGTAIYYTAQDTNQPGFSGYVGYVVAGSSGNGRSADDAHLPGPLATDGTNVYWGDLGDVGDAGAIEPGTGSVSSVPIGALGAIPTVLASNLTPVAITFDATNVYWTNGYTSAGAVFKCAKAGCGHTPTPLAQNQPAPGGIVADATNVYWANGGTNGSDGQIVKCAIAGCTAPTPLVSGLSNPAYLALDNGILYWTNQGPAPGGATPGGSVMACAVGGCGGTPTTMATNLESPYAIATDGIDVYWTDTGTATGNDGEVVKCAIGGCNGQPSVLAKNLQAPTSVAVDAQLVVIATSSFILGISK
jgi:hypothetical protein